ncbi:hypothetical protein FA95DRAFT_1682766 [Auriscalpium vulgare]|uniref:Uncharacterized protein n=1 Tax=Auriscalpium vulgare TaxID=40419 RepID=A0ACB8RD36_9AGAM|nr:hypothetical protein FA95DRAFT_1682766 [Auriscalpium vulgare]
MNAIVRYFGLRQTDANLATQPQDDQSKRRLIKRDMDAQKMATSSEGGPTSTMEAWLSTLRSQLSHVDSSSPEMLSALLNERAAVKSLLSIVDAQINARAPVSRLPPELVVNILSYCMVDGIRAMAYVPTTAPWVRFTWVCRRWRHIMLASPMFWCNFVLPLPPKWSRAMLARSQNLPLSISCSYHVSPSPKQSPAWFLPFDTLERVRSMRMFDLIGSGSAAFYSRLLSTPAPILEVATFFSTPKHLPRDELFANSAPRLRHLDICHARILPLSSFSPILVYLKISNVSDPRQSLPDFIAALNRLSRIETLALEKCLGSFSSASRAPSPSQIAKLPSLECLQISGTVSECLNFLRHVQTPDAMILHVEANTDEGVDDFAALFPFLAPARGYTADPFRAIQIGVEGLMNLTIYARHNDVYADYLPWNRIFTFVWSDENTVWEFLPVLCEEAGMHNWRSLSIEVDSSETAEGPPPVEDWLGLLGAAKELQRLHAAGDAGNALCPTLSATMEHGTYGRASAGTLVWPQLHILELENLDLSYRYKAGEGRSWAECTGMRVDDVLLRELEHRQQRGAAALDKLHLRSCTVDSQWLRKVEGVVGSVFVENIDNEDFGVIF